MSVWGWLTIIGSSVVPAFIIILLAIRASAATKGTKLRATGMAAQATVLEVQPTSTEIGNELVVVLTLEVDPPAGSPYEVQIKAAVHPVNIPRIQPNQKVPVKIDPDDPEHVALDI